MPVQPVKAGRLRNAGSAHARPGLRGPGAASEQRFPIKSTTGRVLFIVFDIEIVFLYPWAVSYDSLGTFALVEWRYSCSRCSWPTRMCGAAGGLIG